MNKDVFRVGLIQTRCQPTAGENLERAIRAIEQARDSQAQIICLPELFQNYYFCKREDADLFDLAEPIPGPTTEKLAQVAKKLEVVLLVSLFEKRAPGVYHNSLAVLDADGTLLGTYRKMHIPDDPLYYEKFYFTPGDLGYRVFPTKYGKIGTLICWDQWFPEAARLTALQGAEILFYPTAIGWHPAEKDEFGADQRQAWQTIQKSHAIANGIYVGAVNRIGLEEDGHAQLEFWGSSFVSDPFGVTMKQASMDEEEVLVVECERGRLEDVRRNWPFYRDRRVETYGDLTRRFWETSEG